MTSLIPVTAALLRAALPGARAADLEAFAPAIDPACERFDITTALRKAHFLAQIAHECGSFSITKENLNYSAQGLRGVFGKYFPDVAGAPSAEAYARQPEKIANLVYANRMGNGPTSSGDGFRYRGRGPIQITGKDMYTRVGAALGIDLTATPDELLDPTFGMMAAAWFWAVEKKLNPLADADDVVTITRRVNGGTNGLDDRTAKLKAFKTAFGLGV